MNYESWTEALAKFWLDDDAGGPVVLALEPNILIDVAKTVEGIFSTPELAAESFIDAVVTYQRSLGSRPWRGESSGGKPRFLLLIAIQVYAASQMDDEQGHHTRNAYYIQLESLVGDRAMSANFAADHGEAHRRLWRTMKSWLAEHGRSINLPSDAAGTHERNVGLPKSQALLRLGDLAELPLFFRQCRYQSDAEYSLERVQNDVARLRESYQAFPSAWARSVLKNSLKYPTASRQIYQELKLWDGRWEIADAGRLERGDAHRVKLWFGINRRKSLLVSRIISSDGDSQLLSMQDVARVLEGKPTKDGWCIVLQRGLCLCRYDADDGAFKQVSSVQPGDRCLLAANGEVAGAIDLMIKLVFASKIALDTQWYPDEEDDARSIVTLDGIPSSCTLVEFRVADPLPYFESVDRDWHSFLKSPTASLVPTGGLRFGREWIWVEGAGPSILIVGNRLPHSIAIDGVEVPVNGRIVSHSKLSERGEHLILGTIDGQDRQRTVIVSDPVEFKFSELPERAWVFENNSAKWQELADDTASLHGMRFSMPQRTAFMSPSEEQRTAIRLLAGHPVRQANQPGSEYNHPLARSLAQSRANQKI